MTRYTALKQTVVALRVEEALLGGAEYQETMAQAIFRAIVRYFE